MKTEIPKNAKPMDVKIVSKEEAYWTTIKENTERQIELIKKDLKFTEAVLEMCDFKLMQEKCK